jgi:hypothetical protein
LKIFGSFFKLTGKNKFFFIFIFILIFKNMSFRQKEIDLRMQEMARRRQYQNSAPNDRYEQEYYQEYPDQYEYEQEYNDQRQLENMNGGKFNYGKLAKGLAKTKVLSTGLMLTGNPKAAEFTRTLGAGYGGGGRSFGGALIGGGYDGYDEYSSMQGGVMQKLKSKQYSDMRLNSTKYGVKHRKPSNFEVDSCGRRKKSDWQIFFDENYNDIKREIFLQLESRKKYYTAKELHSRTMKELGDQWLVSDDNHNKEATIRGRERRAQEKAQKAADFRRYGKKIDFSN